MHASLSARLRSRAGGFTISKLVAALLTGAALAPGCGDELPIQATTGSGGTGESHTASVSSSTGASGGGGGAAVSSSSSSGSSSGTGGAPAGTWWKHLIAPDLSSSWMTVPGAMTVDAHGHVVITGRASAMVSFDVAASVTGAAPRALFVAKYDVDGTLMWAKQFGTSMPYSKITGIATDADDAIVITGHYQGGPVSFGGADLANAGATDLFVAKLDAAGNHVWSLRAGGSSYDLGGRVAIDPLGRVVVAGGIGSHLAVMWISPSGEVLLQKQAPGSVTINASSVSPVSGIAVDADGNAIVSGTFEANGTDFGGGPTPKSPFEAGFVASYAATDGALRWVRTFATKDGNGVTGQGVFTTGIAAHGDSVVFAGNFPKTIDLGGGFSAPLGGASGFVAAIGAADGKPRWSYALGAGSSMLGMTRAPESRLALTATWKGSVSVSGSAVTGAGIHLVTIASGDGSLVAARALDEVATEDPAMQDVQPISVDANGYLAFDFGFHTSLDLPLATITKGAMSLEDLLLVHLPP